MLLTFLMGREAEEAGESAADTLKQRVFASAFGSFDPHKTLEHYYKVFEEPAEEKTEDIVEFVPQNDEDVAEMLRVARSAGVIG